MSLPTDSQARKHIPMARGLLDYFPDALAEVAYVSHCSNEKHNPGEPLHWSKDKSSDHADCLVRHVVERGTVDPDDGLRHSAKAAWRALAMLQIELDAADAAEVPVLTAIERVKAAQERYSPMHPNQVGVQPGIQFAGVQLPELAQEKAWTTVEDNREAVARGGTQH
jgi:hypothetical protein